LAAVDFFLQCCFSYLACLYNISIRTDSLTFLSKIPTMKSKFRTLSPRGSASREGRRCFPGRRLSTELEEESFHEDHSVGDPAAAVPRAASRVRYGANEFEELLRENNQLKEEERKKTEKIQELERAERELQNALISAQQICEEMKNNARKEGDLIIEEAKANARKVLETVQTQAMQVETEIAQLKRQRAQFEATLRGILEMHMNLVDTHPGNQMSPASPKAE
jgi:cell division initiation protein